MGFDIYAKNKQAEEGGYFRNSIRHWPPLWTFIAELCGEFMTPQEIADGFTNKGNGYDDNTNFISAQKTQIIAEKLAEALKNKEKHKLLVKKVQEAGKDKVISLEKLFSRMGFQVIKPPKIRGFEFEELPSSIGIYEDKRDPEEIFWWNVERFQKFCKETSDGFYIR